MSKNLVFAGVEPALALPVPTGTRSGDPVIVGSIIGVAETDRAGDTDTSGRVLGGVGHPTGYAAVAPDGTYALKVPEAVAAAGTPIYIVTATNALTTSSNTGANPLFGYTVPVIDKGVASGATKAADSGGVEGTVNVKLARI